VEQGNLAGRTDIGAGLFQQKEQYGRQHVAAAPEIEAGHRREADQPHAYDRGEHTAQIAGGDGNAHCGAGQAV